MMVMWSWQVMLLASNNMAMPALLNKLATENLVQEASRIIDSFTTIMPYLRVGEKPNLFADFENAFLEIPPRAGGQLENWRPLLKTTSRVGDKTARPFGLRQVAEDPLSFSKIPSQEIFHHPTKFLRVKHCREVAGEKHTNGEGIRG